MIILWGLQLITLCICCSELTNVVVYAGDPWYVALDGSIRNLQVSRYGNDYFFIKIVMTFLFGHNQTTCIRPQLTP